jgi:ABC-type sugar transport system ATPase subunit
VVAVEYLGADTQVETRAGEHTIIVRVGGRLAATPDETVHLAWEAADTHWFDASSGRRIG